MRPILLSGHERALTQIKYVPPSEGRRDPNSFWRGYGRNCWISSNCLHLPPCHFILSLVLYYISVERANSVFRYNLDGDLLFSVSKDQAICAWFAHNGERLGTYNGHVGAIWTVDVDPTSSMIASGSADNTIRLWNVKTGKCLKVWEFPTAVKRVEFNEDGTKLLGVTEKRMGYLSNIITFDINPDVDAEQTDERYLTIVCDESKATVAGWSALTKYIIACHEDGSVSQYDAKSGDLLVNYPIHELNQPIVDMQWAADRTYFITAGKDKSAKVSSGENLLP